jgi:hypothetical protein
MSFPYHPVDPTRAFYPEVQAAADGPELGELRRLVARARRRFVVANGAVFLLALLLDCSADDLPTRRIVGRVTLGMVLGLVQAALLLATAWRHDRLSARHCDMRAEVLRAHVQRERELQAASLREVAADRSTRRYGWW